MIGLGQGEYWPAYLSFARAALAAIEAAGYVVVQREDCPLCPGFSQPCGNSKCPQLKRQWIVDLIREDYDPVPGDWPRHNKGWDDGAEAIADKIIARLKGDGLEGPFHPYHAYSSNITTDREP